MKATTRRVSLSAWSCTGVLPTARTRLTLLVPQNGDVTKRLTGIVCAPLENLIDLGCEED